MLHVRVVWQAQHHVRLPAGPGWRILVRGSRLSLVWPRIRRSRVGALSDWQREPQLTAACVGQAGQIAHSREPYGGARVLLHICYRHREEGCTTQTLVVRTSRDHVAAIQLPDANKWRKGKEDNGVRMISSCGRATQHVAAQAPSHLHTVIAHRLPGFGAGVHVLMLFTYTRVPSV
eukprot:4568780-Prymnesium_polylepis.2